jgi:hypothetical protein
LGFENFVNQYEMGLAAGLSDFPDYQACPVARPVEENSHGLHESMVSSRK